MQNRSHFTKQSTSHVIPRENAWKLKIEMPNLKCIF